MQHNSALDKSKVTGSSLINVSHQQIADAPLAQPGQVAYGTVALLTENGNLCYKECSAYRSIFVM